MELFNYLLKVSACTVLFFAFYLLVLRKLTFFKTNRFYLLATLILSFVIPSLSFTIEREVAEVPIAYVPTETFLEQTLVEQPIISEAVTLAPKIEENFDWYSLLPNLYFAIVACLLCVAFWRLLQLFRHTKENFDEINGLKIFAKSSGFTNCSFFNYVFIDNENISDAELQVLLKHEAVHAKQFHSVDKMLLMLAKAVLWFNPIIYLYDKALEQAHEYEADEATSKSFGTEQYASLLLKLAIAKSEMPLVHNFVKSPIKARIKMLFNSKSKNMKKLMYLLALPVGLGLLWGFTVDVVEVLPKSNNKEKVFTIVLDAGHGGKQNGAEVDGFKEKDISLQFSEKVRLLAEANGINVVATRSNDKEVSLADRLKAEGDFLISFHVNSEPIKGGKSSNGIEMYTPTSDRKLNWIRSSIMTFNLYHNLKTIEGIKVSNKPSQKNLFLLQNSKMPALVLELGYLTSKSDLKVITNKNKQDELAEAIVKGIITYKENFKTDEELLDENLQQLPPKPNQVETPIIKRKVITDKKGIKYEATEININNKVVNTIHSSNIGAVKVFFYVNGKVYNEVEIAKFSKDFVVRLSDKRGAGNTENSYNVEGVESNMNNYVIWFGKEPPLASYIAKNRSVFEKYNGKTVSGKIVDYSFSPLNKALMDGFILKTNNGETLKAFVELKFVKQINAQLAKGDDVSIKIYNSAYWKDSEYPVLTSFKLNKGDKLLMDRWPKTASNSSGKTNMSESDLKSPYSERKKLLPQLLSSTNLRVDTKSNIAYVQNGVYNIKGVELEAKESIFDQTKNTIKATKATITKNGHMIVSDEINVDVNSNYFIVKEIKEPFRLSTFSKISAKSSAGDVKNEAYLANQPKGTTGITYSAQDSTKFDKKSEILYLYGKAKLSSNGTVYQGSNIIYDKKVNTAKVYNASISEKGSKSVFTADSLHLNLNTSKGVFFGKSHISF